MVKTRKIRIGDFVTYAGQEYIVTNKNKVNYRLVRRSANKGHTIIVPRKRVKLADQTWRNLLTRGDAVKLFIGGEWIDASVYERKGNKLLVQPCLNNFTMTVSQDAGIIAQGGHPHALWVKDDITPIVIDSECHMERARGIVFPWTYTSETSKRIVVTGPIPTPLTTLSFDHYDTGGYPHSIYKNLSTAEIMHDIKNHPSKHPDILVLIADQWCTARLPIYPYLRNHYGLRYYISQALAHGDQRRVQEMLSVGEHAAVFNKSEWVVRNHLSHPYIGANFSVRNNTLKVDLFHSGIKIDKTSEKVSKILEHISHPMNYCPRKIVVDSTPELSFILSRMLGMEKTPVELLSTRQVNGSKTLVNLEHGFSEPEMKICGGQLNLRFINYCNLVTELMKRSPMRTLVVVEKDALPIWKDFNIFHGRNRGFKPITVTTKGVFAKNARRSRVFDKTERLIVLVDTDWYSSFCNAAREFRCKIKWACGNSEYGWKNTCMFKSNHKNSKLVISLTKDDMLNMGVEFPTISHQYVVFKIDKESCDVFVRRLKAKYPSMPTWWHSRCKNLLEKFLEHPELVPVEYRGERLAAVEATLSKISEEFGVSENLLDSRAQETCSVCLENISDASVTQCGHIFCSDCMQELQKRQINCPMCRSKITSFLKISEKDTVGKIQLDQGVPYRIPENETWGEKMKFLKKHKDATIITGNRDIGTLLKRKLKKVFRKRQILTIEDLEHNQTPLSSKVIMMNPHYDIQDCVGLAWGKDIEVFSLKYKIEGAPFGFEYS